jgi:pantetheine-phosphate adenylyltransferase
LLISIPTGEFAEAAGACAIIRGVRNTTDFEYERTMEATNHRIYPDITTALLEKIRRL